jgi:hypothetical protein
MPSKTDFKALYSTVITKALNCSVLDGVVVNCQWITQVLAIDNPMPTICTPVGIGRPVVNLVGFAIELMTVHRRILLFGLKDACHSSVSSVF